MEGIILPRLFAGQDPIPPHFRPLSAISPMDKNGDYSYVRDCLGMYLKAGGGDVAVIPLEGTMSRSGFCGMGNEFLISILAEAAAEPQVKAVVLKGNTPGGTVDSVEILADAVKNFPKPIVGYVAGMVASAGVFVFSQLDHIVIENSSASRFGSIGVMMVYVNESKALEMAGKEVIIFRAGESVDKVTVNPVEPLTDALKAEIQTELDDAMAVFKGYVKRGRAGKLNSSEVFSAKMYNKADAIKYGLVDSSGTLADAIKIARKL